jgi:flavodoxin
MNKILALVLAIMMGLSIAACGNTGSDNNSTVQGQQSSTKENNILVAYFSHTGNTREIANQIHERVGGDIFEIVTVDLYPNDYNACVDKAKQEQNDNSRPVLATKVEKMDSYDVVFVGYPIWWETMPMAVFTFLEEYDFSGKTIIPFCTHEGSDLGSSVEDIKKLCPQSTILEGLAVRGSNVNNAQNDVSEWLREIGMIE